MLKRNVLLGGSNLPRSISASVFGPGGGGVQIRCDAGHSVYLRPRPAAAGSKSQPIFKPAKHRRVGALLILL